MFTGFVIGDRALSAAGDTHPAWMLAHAELAAYLVVGASSVGKIHLAQRLPRDDAFVIRSAGPWLAVGVADGVGSRPFSRFGATYVAEALTSQLLRKLTRLSIAHKHTQQADPPPAGDSSSLPMRDEHEMKNLAPPPTTEEIDLDVRIEVTSSGSVQTERVQKVGSIGWVPAPTTQFDFRQSTTSHAQFKSPLDTMPMNQHEENSTTSSLPEPDLLSIMDHAFAKTHLGLKEHAESLGLELADLSCTALAFLLNVQTGRLAVGQIGDGALLGLTAQGKLVELAQATETGDPQSVYTINRSNFSKYLDRRVIEPPAANPFVAFYVMTDGISHDLLYSSQPREPWSHAINKNLRATASSALAAAEMLNWLSTYQVKGSWDDRTLVVIMQREENDDNSQPPTGQPESAESTDNC